MENAGSKVDAFMARAKSWKPEMEALRSIVLECGLQEEFKWYKPCYTFQDGIINGIAGLKDHCWLMFFKGALLRDPAQVLIAPGENSQSQRVMKFSNLKQIEDLKPTIKAYIAEAIEAEKAGLKVDFSKSKNLVFPEEFTQKLDVMPDLRQAFDSLTPGRQRAYNLYFSQPKLSATRISRIEKYISHILAGKGITD